MTSQKLNRSYQRRLAIRRKSERDLYRERRQYFEIQPEYKGWFWKKRLIGYVVYVFRVEGWSMAASYGSVGTVVEYPISEIQPTKFAAYRWILNNVCDYDDFCSFVY
jgi:hypothetical protein